LVKGIAAGMHHLHRENIVHRDLAARNILLDELGTAKISDFGMARVLDGEKGGQTASNIGPIRWMSPESIRYKQYSTKSDVWSFGIVIFEIVARKEPHEDESLLDVGMKIRDNAATPEMPKNTPVLLEQLCRQCWKVDPEARPTFKEVLETFKAALGPNADSMPTSTNASVVPSAANSGATLPASGATLPISRGNSGVSLPMSRGQSSVSLPGESFGERTFNPAKEVEVMELTEEDVARMAEVRGYSELPV